eukprot:5919934-Pyramimonas_sp.AAC.1
MPLLSEALLARVRLLLVVNSRHCGLRCMRLKVMFGSRRTVSLCTTGGIWPSSFTPVVPTVICGLRSAYFSNIVAVQISRSISFTRIRRANTSWIRRPNRG